MLSLGNKIKNTIIQAAELGLNIPELALVFCFNKNKISYKEYDAFCIWIDKNASFYYWLRSRLNGNYRIKPNSECITL